MTMIVSRDPLLRLHGLSAGRALLNGHDLASYSADEVRTVISGCPQDPHIFDASVRANLQLARPSATDAELADAAGRARLLPWISSLPQGWDTQVGLRGVAMSDDLLRVTRGRATLLITHDLDGLDQVDDVIVLERGKIAERGTHDQLVATPGLYRQMWRAQVSAIAAGMGPGAGRG
jgi:ABC-type multidrug transport system fused ATPase/permease subunit